MATVHLRCPECSYENEPERVYCHNCGGKLDRALLPKAEDDKKHESPEKARRRIKKMTNPGSSPVMREFKALLQTLMWGAIAAAVILIARAPDGLPDPKAAGAGRLVQSDLTEALESPTPRTIAFSEGDLNQALKQSLRGEAGSIIPGIKFERAFVNLLPGVVRVGNEQSMWGHPVYSSVSYRAQMKDGKFAPVLVAGSYGRLPVHPAAMEYLDFPFERLWTALKRQRTYLDKLQQIGVEKGQVNLTTKGAAAAR